MFSPKIFFKNKNEIINKNKIKYKEEFNIINYNELENEILKKAINKKDDNLKKSGGFN